jgi:hypothetical protein
MSWMRLIFFADLTGVDLISDAACLGVYYLFVADFVGVFFEPERSLIGVLDDIK